MNVLETWIQLKFSRTDGRSWTTGVSGFGERSVHEAREMTRTLIASNAVTHIDVIIEKRNGATTLSSDRYEWSSNKKWH